MSRMFSNLEAAIVWLVVNKWRQTEEGEWYKGKQEADLYPSPAKDGVVALHIRRLSAARALRA